MRKKIVFSMMLSTLFVLTNLILPNTASAQMEFPEDKVSWKFTIDQDGEDATIIGTITIVDEWHINSIVLPEMSFGWPTSITFTSSKNYKAIGKVVEPKPHVVYDEESDETLSYHEGKVIFKQKIKVLSEDDFTIKGVFDFQTCNDVRCLKDLQADFTVKVKGVEAEEVDEVDENIEETFTEVNGDEAKDKDGVVYVKVADKWHAVPEGNSAGFYKKYLTLVGDE